MDRANNLKKLLSYLGSVEGTILRRVKSLNTSLNRTKMIDFDLPLPSKKLRIEDASTKVTENWNYGYKEMPEIDLENVVLPEVRNKNERCSSDHLGKRALEELLVPFEEESDCLIGGSVMF